MEWGWLQGAFKTATETDSYEPAGFIRSNPRAIQTILFEIFANNGGPKPASAFRSSSLEKPLLERLRGAINTAATSDLEGSTDQTRDDPGAIWKLPSDVFADNLSTRIILLEWLRDASKSMRGNVSNGDTAATYDDLGAIRSMAPTALVVNPSSAQRFIPLMNVTGSIQMFHWTAGKAAT